MRRDYPSHAKWFDDGFFERHHYTPYHYRRGYNWWRPAEWSGVSTWLGWSGMNPIYYQDIGYPIYEPAYVDYYPEIEPAYRNSYGPQTVAVQEDWLSLGLFAIGKDQMEGLVDKDTQQAVWRLTNTPSSALTIAGLYELTQAVASVRMQFQDGTEQS